MFVSSGSLQGKKVTELFLEDETSSETMYLPSNDVSIDGIEVEAGYLCGGESDM